MLALLDELIGARVSAHVPAGVVAQVWRGSSRQHAVVRILKAEAVRIHAMSETVAFQIGMLLARRRTSDVVDAHVAILGRTLHAAVLSSDPDELRRLDAELDVVPL